MERLSLSELKERGFQLRKHRYKCPGMDFRELLRKIEPLDLQIAYLRFYEEHPAFRVVPAGTKHHHWWEGGLETHCKEMIGIGFDLLEIYPGDFHDKVTQTDVVITVFLHDFAKVVTYTKVTEEDRLKNSDKFWEKQQFKFSNNGAFDLVDRETWTILELGKWGINPTKQQWSAVLFAEGGYSDANFGFQGVTHAGAKALGANALIPFLHILDLYSSQLLGKSLIVERAVKERRDAESQNVSREVSTAEPEPQGSGGGKAGPGDGREGLRGTAG